MLYRPRWKGRLFGFETTFDMKQYILWLSGQLNVLTLWGNIMHTLSRNHEEENIYMYRYIAHKNQQYHDDALMGQSSQCFAQFISICHTCKCCSALRGHTRPSLVETRSRLSITVHVVYRAQLTY